MLVLVRYNDDNYDIVEDYCLEYLIVTGKVMEFSRSDRWVTVGAEPTREKSDVKECSSNSENFYNGPERRKRPHRNLLHTPLIPATT
jgi:hypothetical protein